MPAPTDDDLVEYVEHINYELQMMRHARDFHEGGWWDGNDRAAWLAAEAGLVHCRNLIDFFRGANSHRNDKRPDDVIAWDYAKRRWDPRRTNDLLAAYGTPDDLSKRINTRVMHLGRGRNTVERVNFIEVAHAIDRVWREWRQTLSADWQDRFDE